MRKRSWLQPANKRFWIWDDDEKRPHLMRDDEEVTARLKCRWVYAEPNGDWKYRGDDGFCHLMREIDGEWEELTEGLKNCYWAKPLADNEGFKWKDSPEGEPGNYHFVRRERLASLV